MDKNRGGGKKVDVFRRKELKFLLDEQQLQTVETALHHYMVPDPHGPSTICNLYYDTPDYRLIRHSLDHPVYKEKLRLRCYGMSRPGADIFLELKKKYQGVVYKRRIKVTEQEAMDFMNRKAPLLRQTQIGREILYFRDFYRDLRPRVYLSYDREAWLDPAEQGFRMTLDRNICYRTEALSLSAPFGGRQILRSGQTLLEVKAEGAVPLWLVRLLTQEQIKKQSFSKYGCAYQEMLTEQKALQKG